MFNGSHLPKKKSFVLVRPVVTYEIANGSAAGKGNMQFRVVNYVLYGKGKAAGGISDTSLQLVRTCLVVELGPEDTKFFRRRVRTNGLIRDFLRINLVKSNISYLRKRDHPSGNVPIISLGQFLCENVRITKRGPYLKSGQVLIVQVNSVVNTTAKLILATPGATVHGHLWSNLSEGDSISTFIMKSRSWSPKVEQVLEVRSLDSISMNLERELRVGHACNNKNSLGFRGFGFGADNYMCKSLISFG
ncbi:hypothetical protein CUMW_181550 [Citrus unshiu]|uniref:Uncharacterized protein n=1 Tax=Citrus unshiu TaxID=55188 RepID=A0A2H5PZE3_CITUN|nr:hypothetical protein CUMW_181550 [Citrus unshiu]